MIIAFDMIQKSLFEIHLLDHLIIEKYDLYSLRVLEGSLCVCCTIKGSAKTAIWVMKEYKVQSSWNISNVIPTYHIFYNHFSPIRVTKYGEFFLSNILRILHY